MTQTLPPGGPSAPPPPPPGRAQSSAAGATPPGAAAPGTTPGSSPPPGARRVRDTPALLRIAAVILAVAGLLVGLVAAQASWSANRALERAADNAAQLVRLQDIQTSLVAADALATNAFLVGGLEPADQREAYEAAVAQAGQEAALAAGAQPADGEALAVLVSGVQDYVGFVELARANNRQGFPVGAQYLRLASGGLRADTLPVLAALRDANEARAEAELATASSARVAPIIVGLLGLGVIVGGLVWLARLTHRYVNLPLAGAGVVVLVVLVVGTVVLGSVAGAASRTRSGPFAQALAVSSARIGAFDAKSNESLTLISRGSGAAFEEAWQSSAASTVQSLDEAAAAAGDTDGLAAAWSVYADRHAAIRELDTGGDWEGAVAAATSRDEGSANAAFDAFDTASAAALDAASSEVASTLAGASGGLTAAAVLSVLAGLAAAALAWWGLAQRLEEYR